MSWVSATPFKNLDMMYSQAQPFHRPTMIPIIPTLNGIDMFHLRDTVLTAPVFGSAYGDYPWDRWEKAALTVGLSPELANTGRTVFREAFQHNWPDHLMVECGWLDGGVRMIYQALAFPEQCLARWSFLYSADNEGDAAAAEPVTTDPLELARALKKAGYTVALVTEEQ